MIAAFAWGILGAASLLLGAVIVFIRVPSDRFLGLVMGFGAGALISAVSFELVEEATDVAGGSGMTALGLFCGALVFSIGDYLIANAGARKHKSIGAPAGAAAAGLAIVLGAVLDGVPESAVLGLTILQTGAVGVSILVAVFISNLPEAIAATDGLLRGGWSKRKVLGLWAIVTAVSGLASAAGYAVLDGASVSALAFVLAFAGGAILTMLATSMMPEAFAHGGRLSGLTTVLGFAVAYGVHWMSG